MFSNKNTQWEFFLFAEYIGISGTISSECPHPWLSSNIYINCHSLAPCIKMQSASRNVGKQRQIVFNPVIMLTCLLVASRPASCVIARLQPAELASLIPLNTHLAITSTSVPCSGVHLPQHPTSLHNLLVYLEEAIHMWFPSFTPPPNDPTFLLISTFPTNFTSLPQITRPHLT